MSTTPLPGGSVQPERTGMSQGAKIFIVLLVLLLVFGMCAVFFAFSLAGAIGFTVAHTVTTAVDDGTGVAAGIAEFDVPAGYDDSYAINAIEFSMVGYNGEDGHSHIMLAQLPSWVRVDAAELERQMRDAAAGARGDGARRHGR